MNDKTGAEDRPDWLPSEAERFRRLEYPGDDLPFYSGRPKKISGAKWWVVMAGVAAGFIALTARLPFYAIPAGTACHRARRQPEPPSDDPRILHACPPFFMARSAP